MAITFPNSPTIGDETTINGRLFVFDGIGWKPDNLVSSDTSDIVENAALSNIETSAGAFQTTINTNIDNRLFEQIAFTLTGYDVDVTTDSKDVLKSLPYAFKAYEIKAEFGTAPTGSNAVVTFYKNGVSIGTAVVIAGQFSGTTVLSPVVSFAKGDSLGATVTQIGLTIPGATAKAYVQGIKYQ